jgi:large subunit ribosomal protein L15
MLNLNTLKPTLRSSKRRKVVGRGLGSGHGTYSGRGAKGQKARSGSSIPVGFEGGRMPLQRQIPKLRGFKSSHPKAATLSLGKLDVKFKAGETVNPKQLLKRGLTESAKGKVKILGDGKITKALNFENVNISAGAVEKITQAGGKVIKPNV